MQVCFAQTVNAQTFSARGRSADDFHVGQPQREATGEETAQCLVRLAFDRRGSQAHEQHAVAPAADFVSRGALRYAYLEECVFRHWSIVNG